MQLNAAPSVYLIQITWTLSVSYIINLHTGTHKSRPNKSTVSSSCIRNARPTGENSDFRLLLAWLHPFIHKSVDQQKTTLDGSDLILIPGYWQISALADWSLFAQKHRKFTLLIKRQDATFPRSGRIFKNGEKKLERFSIADDNSRTVANKFPHNKQPRDKINASKENSS